MNNLVLAADIGGTHITAALIDVGKRQIIKSSLMRKPVNSGAAAAPVIRSWSACMQAAMQDATVSKICIAMPGPFDYHNGVSLMTAQGKYDALYGLNIKQLLAAALDRVPQQFFIKNDAACFLQGEIFAGAVNESFDQVLGITLGTGLGSAFYKQGIAENADLWKHPFREGIAEDYLSTRWFVQRYAALSGRVLNGVQEIAACAATDENIPLLFKEFGKNLGAFLKCFIEMNPAEAVVIGGNITRAYEAFQREIELVLHQQFPLVTIRRSVLGEAAALYGAAASWLSQEVAGR
ncbi:ROK family protein [Niabella sp. CC-SYL272]|uniref:ROK family protein n=1 Tax=Niabella agricola TaxID=2891571 RepID=UPI001F21B715|nr:ROK family protein [Niabella agricola]MCF3109396.1 ROK family protein [Niabella agricola]